MRQIAAAIGTSHRMLLYHFGSREGLLVAISNAINEDVAGTLDRWAEPRELFRHFTDPEAWPWERLFFELYAHALLGRPGTDSECGSDAVFLCSSMSGYVTGAVIPVDGGTWASSGWLRNRAGKWVLTGDSGP